MAGGKHTKMHRDTEIFDLKTQTWSGGQPLPFSLMVSQNSFQYDRGTILVAGYKDETSKYAKSEILEYSGETHAWKLRDGANLLLTAKMPRIFLLDRDLSKC